MKVTTYNDKNITSIITIAEKVRTEEGDSYDVTVEEITNNLSITKARELDLEIID
jgi:undecaprenyl pyrophosphate synthase